jgi:hypothetical protein
MMKGLLYVFALPENILKTKIGGVSASGVEDAVQVH